jgi:CRISPR system Cascade subunit CasB
MNVGKSVLDEAQRAFVRDWWKAMQPRRAGDPPLPSGLAGLDRGTRAELRRATDADALLMLSSTHVLADRLLALDAKRPGPLSRTNKDDSAHLRIALIAGVLAHVRDHGEGRRSAGLARQLGRASNDPPLMSELRFKRLLKAKDEADLLRQWRRAVALAGNELDVAQLADDLLAWQIELGAPPVRATDGVRFRWANDYYLSTREQNAASEPAAIEELSE